jgi:hypothetical protein
MAWRADSKGVWLSIAKLAKRTNRWSVSAPFYASSPRLRQLWQPVEEFDGLRHRMDAMPK